MTVFKPSDGSQQIIRCSDLYPPTSTGAGTVRIDSGLAPDAPVMLGRCYGERLRPGLMLHCADVLDLHDLNIQSAEQGESLHLALILDGDVDVSFGPGCLRLSAGGHGRRPQAAFIQLLEPELFVRRAWRGKRERKVSIGFSREWLAASCPEGDAGYLALFNSHLAVERWTPTPRAVALAEQLIRPSDDPPLLRKLHQESRVIELVVEALRQMTNVAPPPTLLPRERRRAADVRELLDSGAADDMSLDDIARHAGTNVSTLQKQFRALCGVSVFEYLRRARLLRARQALECEGRSIVEAAGIAGYTSSANFATAYRRAFGVTPSQSRAGF
ncbi:MAG: helix-turn-helix transcriptional regulator [Dechloromonas sp.]|nr:MAG: helix-turn-helix transcriptional regulator [Dechloromonas sp.]